MCCRFSPATMLRYYVFSRPFHRKPSAKNMWPPTQLYMHTQSTWDDLSSVKVLKFQFISLQTSIIQETIKWYIRLTKTKKKWPHGDLFIKQKCITLKTLKKTVHKVQYFHTHTGHTLTGTTCKWLPVEWCLRSLDFCHFHASLLHTKTTTRH